MTSGGTRHIGSSGMALCDVKARAVTKRIMKMIERIFFMGKSPRLNGVYNLTADNSVACPNGKTGRATALQAEARLGLLNDVGGCDRAGLV